MTFQSVLCEAAHSFLLVDLWERKEHIEVRQPEVRALQEGGKVTQIKAKKKNHTPRNSMSSDKWSK